jgi:hypothetical protein
MRGVVPFAGILTVRNGGFYLFYRRNLLKLLNNQKNAYFFCRNDEKRLEDRMQNGKMEKTSYRGQSLKNQQLN